MASAISNVQLLRPIDIELMLGRCLQRWNSLLRPLAFADLPQNGKTIVEYLWIGGSGLDIRSKTRVFPSPRITSLDQVSDWNFDGSSTGQAEGSSSEVVLKPRAMWKDPIRGGNNMLVLCDTFIPGNGPANSNFRIECAEIMEKVKEEEPWFAYEQEYILFNTRVTPHWPIGFPDNGFPKPQGPYYCSVGADVAFGREICEAHLRASLLAGLAITGTNVEVFPGQLEFQIGPVVGINAADELWLARYLLLRIAEMYGVGVSLMPKPVLGDWNGSGAHTNYSTNSTRADNGITAIHRYIEQLQRKHKHHIELYGEGNETRLTGRHETAAIDVFRWGVGDRGASIRVPNTTHESGKGYLEDRRPASNMDPYVVSSLIADTTLLDGKNTERLYKRYKALHPRKDYF